MITARQTLAEEHDRHEQLSAYDRRIFSFGRSIGFALSLLEKGNRLQPASGRPWTIWVLNARHQIENFVARQHSFEEVNFLTKHATDVVLVGDFMEDDLLTSISESEDETLPRVRGCTWESIQQDRNIPKPDVNVIFEDIESFASSHSFSNMREHFKQWPHYVPTVIVSNHIEDEVKEALVDELGDHMLFKLGADYIQRNPFSALAGDDRFTYDENGWIYVVRDIDAVISANRIRERSVPAKRDLHDQAKITACYWGIFDLKYDPARDMPDRVKVLETGDGKTSKFSHAGAEIPKRFRARYKLDEGLSAGKHAVVSANKKLTHDLMEHYGFEHLVPKQACFPREYRPNLHEDIKRELGARSQDLVVLKLCNRSRAAGVIPVPAMELDSVLKDILRPPEKLELWLQQKVAKGITETLESLDWGCYEEQKRHWWSNECPSFVAEEFCSSMLTEKDGKYFDGTMRISFVIYRRPKSSESGRQSEQTVYLQYNNPLLDSGPNAEELEVDWIGGYWKLPKDDIESIDIRNSVISAARTAGTAAVDRRQLQEVYAAMGDSVQKLFGGCEPSPIYLKETYKNEPELACYLTARLAIALKDLSRMRLGLRLADTLLQKADDSLKKHCAESFWYRGCGILEAKTGQQTPGSASTGGDWTDAREYFAEAVESLPSNAAALYLLGMAELFFGKLDDAEDLMHRSLILDLDFKAPYVNLGVVFLRLGKYQEAYDVSKAGLKRHPDTAQCLYHMGVAAYQLAYEREQTTRRAEENKEIEFYRTEALDKLRLARDSPEAQREQNRSPWLEADDEMWTSLSENGPRLRRVAMPDKIGWRFVIWRN